MILQRAETVTVAILAQGTSWAVAVTQAFLLAGSMTSVRDEMHSRTNLFRKGCGASGIAEHTDLGIRNNEM